MYCTHPYFSSVFLNKSLLCIVPIHITHQYSQQIIIMYCTHPYYLISILNKPLLCIVPIHIIISSVFSTNHYYVLYPSIFTHKYSQQTIIMYCTHPYYLISILNKSLLCIVPSIIISSFSTKHYYLILLISIIMSTY